MRFLCEGHEYRYLEVAGEGRLIDNYGTEVANLVRGCEYIHALLADGARVGTLHENCIDDDPAVRGTWLTHAYVAATS